jgi:hypothetical protein
MKVTISWVIAPYSLHMYQLFVRTYQFYLHGRESAEQETSVVPGGYVLWYIHGLHGAISQSWHLS